MTVILRCSMSRLKLDIFTIYSIASFCKESVSPPPEHVKAVLERQGLSFGRCFFNNKDGPVPSCPNITVCRMDSIWKPSKLTNEVYKIVYLWEFTITARKNIPYIYNAKLNITFSSPVEVSSTSVNKVTI